MTSGLAISENFFRQWALPFIDSRWPDISERIAVGRIFGSDVLGNDDVMSRDHNWGPQFLIWLTASDHEVIGAELDEILIENAPNPWNGFRLNGNGVRSVLVHNVETYCNEVFPGRYPDFRNPPWDHLKVYESHLYYIRHSAVWHAFWLGQRVHEKIAKERIKVILNGATVVFGCTMLVQSFSGLN